MFFLQFCTVSSTGGALMHNRLHLFFGCSHIFRPKDQCRPTLCLVFIVFADSIFVFFCFLLAYIFFNMFVGLSVLCVRRYTYAKYVTYNTCEFSIVTCFMIFVFVLVISLTKILLFGYRRDCSLPVLTADQLTSKYDVYLISLLLPRRRRSSTGLRGVHCQCNWKLQPSQVADAMQIAECWHHKQQRWAVHDFRKR